MNKINILDDYAEVELYDVYGNVIKIAIIDLDDVALISKYKWCYHKGYAITKDPITKKEIGMHNLIMGVQSNDIFIDHIFHEREDGGLDNRKNNLRLVNRIQNSQNSVLSINNTSGIKGVDWDKQREKWRARISINKKRIILGWFDNKEDAIKARKNAEKEFYGEYNYRGE